MLFFFFFKQKTAYEMSIIDWSSDLCAPDLPAGGQHRDAQLFGVALDRLADQFAPAQAAVETRHRLFAAVDHDRHDRRQLGQHHPQIGRASGRESVCQYLELAVVAVTLKKKEDKNTHSTNSTTITITG